MRPMNLGHFEYQPNITSLGFLISDKQAGA
jgi:hypothetical protein